MSSKGGKVGCLKTTVPLGQKTLRTNIHSHADLYAKLVVGFISQFSDCYSFFSYMGHHIH